MFKDAGPLAQVIDHGKNQRPECTLSLTRTSRNKAKHFLAMAKQRATLRRKARKGMPVPLEFNQ
jgi:hypothetical protein